MPALVSILIPCHNAEPWVGDAIASAARQSWPSREIILVDDGSTDASLAEARRWEGRAPIRILSQPNRGAAAARNAAFAASRGEWIQYLDADDLLLPDKIERQLQDGPDPEYVHCGRWARFSGDPALAQFEPEPLCRDGDPVDWVVEKLERHAMMHPAAWLVSRALAERAGPWDETLSLDDDGEYFTRLVLLSRGVRHHAQAGSLYRSQLRRSLSGRRSAAAWASALRSLEASSARLLARENSPRTRHACATALIRYAQEAYPEARACRRRAMARARELGGAEVEPLGGPRFQRLRRWLGWRLARRLQKALRR